jgi:glycosyltransferase involved in cell wall biosynthesis
MNQADFTVHLPVYIRDRPDFFQQSIDSIYAQTLLPREIVIIEDGPVAEGVRQIIDRCRENPTVSIKSVRFEKNMGMGVAFAEGVRAASYELIARMDADDIAVPNRFELQFDFMTAHPDIDICGGWLSEFFDDLNDIRQIKKVPELHDAIFRYAKKRCPFNHPTVMYKRSAVIAAGNYNQARNLEDYNLWVRMLHRGSKAHNLQTNLLFFRANRNMYSRRGGFRYYLDEVRSLHEFYRIGFYSFKDFLMQSLIRFVFRLVPSRFRFWLYTKLLRR